MTQEGFPSYESLPYPLNRLIGREVVQAGFERDELSTLILRISVAEDEKAIISRQLLLEKEVRGKKLYKPVNGKIIFGPLIDFIYELAKKQGQTIIYDPEYEELERIPPFPFGINPAANIRQEIYDKPDPYPPDRPGFFTLKDGDASQFFSKPASQYL